jgi:TRAP-type C4-dicarboxylate transport system permease small subunit
MAVKIFSKIDRVKPVFDFVNVVLMQICKAFLVATVIVTTLMVSGRFISFMPSFHWSQEIILTLMSYMAMLAASLALRRGAHIRMVILDKFFPKTMVKVMDVLVDLAILYVCYLFLTLGWEFAIQIGSRGTYVSLPWLSLIVRYLPIPLGGFFMIFFGLEVLYNHIKLFFIEEDPEDGKTDDDKIVEQLLKKDGEIE